MTNYVICGTFIIFIVTIFFHFLHGQPRMYPSLSHVFAQWASIKIMGRWNTTAMVFHVNNCLGGMELMMSLKLLSVSY